MIAGARLHSINLQLTRTGRSRRNTDKCTCTAAATPSNWNIIQNPKLLHTSLFGHWRTFIVVLSLVFSPFFGVGVTNLWVGFGDCPCFLPDWLFKWVRLHFWQIFSSSVSGLQKALVCLAPVCLALHILLVISSSTNDFLFFFWLQSLKSCEKELAGKKLSLFSSQILVRAKTKVCARESEISRNKWGGLGRLRGQTHATTETI